MPNDAEVIMNTMEQQPGACTATLAFLHAAISASRAGIPRCHLVSNSINGALLQELFSRDGIGTQIVTEAAERLRAATINDIGGILDLIRPLEQQGLLVRRSREQLEMEIDQFVVIERDGLVIGCAALYPFPEENVGEFACLAVHPNYRDADRGTLLLKNIIQLARQRKYYTLFALTTRSIHWFLEHGFELKNVEDLPAKKQQLYNYQRRSKNSGAGFNLKQLPPDCSRCSIFRLLHLLHHLFRQRPRCCSHLPPLTVNNCCCQCMAYSRLALLASALPANNGRTPANSRWISVLQRWLTK